uniref:Geminin coiled-coil domain containing n=1 Tax=Anas platyrhynchos TaxID=8839 RepID=A0A8B9ZGI1_ANAPL
MGCSSQSKHPVHQIQAACTIGQVLLSYRVNTYSAVSLFLQLQDTLLQKEEELARLHEENNNLRQYLNSALIKCLEEKAKKVLSCHGQKNSAILKSTKRRLKEDYCFTPQETPHASKARRNLFNEFTACEEQASPAVDSWVLQTLGLKDVDTIDESSANYSALSSDLGKDSYCLSPDEAIDYGHSEGAAAAYSYSHVPPDNSSVHPCSTDSTFLPQFPSAPCSLVTSAKYFLPPSLWVAIFD